MATLNLPLFLEPIGGGAQSVLETTLGTPVKALGKWTRITDPTIWHDLADTITPDTGSGGTPCRHGIDQE